MNVNRHAPSRAGRAFLCVAKVSRPTATRTARSRDALRASVPLARVRATVPIDASRRIRRGWTGSSRLAGKRALTSQSWCPPLPARTMAATGAQALAATVPTVPTVRACRERPARFA